MTVIAATAEQQDEHDNKQYERHRMDILPSHATICLLLRRGLCWSSLVGVVDTSTPSTGNEVCLGFGASQLLSPCHPGWRTLVEEVADRAPCRFTTWTHPPDRARRRGQWLPAGDGPRALAGLRHVGDQRKQPAQLDGSRQLTTPVESGADRCGLCLGDDEHPGSMGTRIMTGKRLSDDRRARAPSRGLINGMQPMQGEVAEEVMFAFPPHTRHARGQPPVRTPDRSWSAYATGWLGSRSARGWDSCRTDQDGQDRGGPD